MKYVRKKYYLFFADFDIKDIFLCVAVRIHFYTDFIKHIFVRQNLLFNTALNIINCNVLNNC